MKKLLLPLLMALSASVAYSELREEYAAAEWVLFVSKTLDPEFMVRMDDDNRLDFPYSYSDGTFADVSGKRFTIMMKGAKSKTYSVRVKMINSKMIAEDGFHDSEMIVKTRLNGLTLTDQYQTILEPATNTTIVPIPTTVDKLGYSLSSGKLDFSIDKITKATDKTVKISPDKLPSGAWKGDIVIEFVGTWSE